MDDFSKQIPKPKSWMDFENLCHLLFVAIWNDPYAEKNGRSGQKQKGVDVFGSPNQQYGIYDGVQCKGKNVNYGSAASINEIEQEIAKAENFSPPLRHWIFATTAPVDASLQEEFRKRSTERLGKGQFTISIFGWEQIEFLLCSHKNVLNAIYPELGVDIDTIIKELKAKLPSEIIRDIKAILSDSQFPPAKPSKKNDNGWVPITYAQGRGLTPALLGRSMGPSDAISCPELSEVPGVIRDLTQGFATRIVGEPGSGKSLCAFQAIKHFAESGWQVYRLIDSNGAGIELPEITNSGKTLLFIDDAHILNAIQLRILEEQSGSGLLLLSTHNAVGGQTSSRNVITIDSKRAVSTIAKSLMLDPHRTLTEVSKVDKDVGEKMMDVNIEDRIAEAQDRSAFPWQFCFNLGGGWRRSQNLADAAHQANAAIVLAGLAIHQLASRDSPIQLDQAKLLLKEAGIDEKSVDQSVKWLVGQRLLLSPIDLRTPHQRFSSIVLNKILKIQDENGRAAIGKIMQEVLSDDTYPLTGKRVLLHELRFSANYGCWSYLIPESCLKQTIEECWNASEAEDVLHSCYFLDELSGYMNDWPESLCKGHEITLANWISNAEYPTGWGLARLIHGVGNQHKDLIVSIVSQSDPASLAKVVNDVEPLTAAHLGELVSAVGHARETKWYNQFSIQIDHVALTNLAKTWPESTDLWAFSNFCKAINGIDEDLGLTLAEKIIPCAKKAFARDPISTFLDLDDLMMLVLRVYDPLRIFIGKRAPQRRHRQIARQMLTELNAEKAAQEFSEVSLRKMQNAAGLLTTIRTITPAKHTAIVENIDWQNISETIGAHWANLPHEAEVFLGVCFGKGATQSLINQVILDNLDKIESFPPRLVVLSPGAAIKHAESRKEIRLAAHDHVAWGFGQFVIALFAEEKPGLLSAVLGQAEKATGSAFSEHNHSWYEEAYDYLKLVHKVAPQNMQSILDGVDVSGASKGWTDSLKHGKGARKTAAFLIECAISRNDELGSLAISLRKSFPKASLPPAN